MRITGRVWCDGRDGLEVLHRQNAFCLPAAPPSELGVARRSRLSRESCELGE